MAPLKLMVLKDRIRQRFPSERLVQYHMEFSGIDPDSQKPKLVDTNGKFSQAVYEFFQKRISLQYPLEQTQLDPFQHVKEQHEAFMKSRCDFVFGRDDVLKQIDSYVCLPANHVPLMLLGNAGTGKSSVMCRAADQAVNKALTGNIPGGGRTRWHVFYHFVGAVPGSTELFAMLKRLLLEMSVVSRATMPTSLDMAVQLTCGALTNDNTKPIIIFIDALNQFDEDQASAIVSWMPRKLAPHVRCVFAMITDTPQHKALTVREPAPQEFYLQPLTRHTGQIIVEQLLAKYGKRLDANQMCTLLDKESSINPLWLSIAVEELRVYGNFRKVSEKIEQLADGLLELEIQVLERFEHESGGELLVATLSLLEVSARGLLETELLVMLADYDNLMPQEKGGEKRDKGKEKRRDVGKLPAAKWAVVYGALRPFLRPFGESGEGRLDFYHRSLSKAVRKRYFSGTDETDVARIYNWWHAKLADFFETTGANIQRKIEEYPVHLIAIHDQERLEKFLVEWEVFEHLFDEEYSYKLLQLWREGSDLERLRDSYLTSINNLANTPDTTKDHLSRKQEEIAELLVQSGNYKEAQELAEKAMALEREELGSRPERMSELYFLLAYVQDETMKLIEFMYRSQLPQMRKIVDNYEAAAKLLRQLPGEFNKVKLARTLNRLSFYYSGYASRGGDDYLGKAAATEKALTAIETAIETLKELNDEPHIADALVTKGVAYGSAVPEQIKAYKEAQTLALRVVGENNTTTNRLYVNMAIYYEEVGNYDLAYDYFRKWYDVSCELYGKQHPITGRPIKTLKESVYRRIAATRGDDIPGACE
ncbi:hypothetical protein NP493_979g00007 [Ridgeia piscesae]|uniref:Orc1-like AAA ATPase domain-containing protein n=1 Tax=Ridgeia piscesae TaxID=27915 RepID=A0AAD9KIJ2_RIDPI|nr:hypothetical protein NP493_979g00007 [Ridgeia piscesae]